MDYEKEIERLKARIVECEQIIKETSVPIISSIVENTILVPVVGYAGSERFELIRSRVLEYLDKNRHVNCAVFDFTGADLDKAKDAQLNVLAIELDMLNSTLKLMGVRPISVGFNPHIVREIVSAGIQMEFESYINFRTALKVLLKEEGRSLSTI